MTPSCCIWAIVAAPPHVSMNLPPAMRKTRTPPWLQRLPVGGIEPVSQHEVIEVYNKNNARVKDCIYRIIEKLDSKQRCKCQHALEGARA